VPAGTSTGGISGASACFGGRAERAPLRIIPSGSPRLAIPAPPPPPRLDFIRSLGFQGTSLCFHHRSTEIFSGWAYEHSAIRPSSISPALAVAAVFFAAVCIPHPLVLRTSSNGNGEGPRPNDKQGGTKGNVSWKGSLRHRSYRAASARAAEAGPSLAQGYLICHKAERSGSPTVEEGLHERGPRPTYPALIAGSNARAKLQASTGGTIVKAGLLRR